MFKRLISLVFAVSLALAQAGCAVDSPTSTQQTQQTAIAASQQSATLNAVATSDNVTPGPTPLAGDGPWTVDFQAADDTALNGVLYGRGAVGVVLAPMYPGAKEGWASFAQAAAQQGYRALAFDFRGYGKSAGSRDASSSPVDLGAAVAYLKANDAQQVIIIGAGQGGMAAIKIAPQDEVVRGIVVISSAKSYDSLEVTGADLAALTTPSLWLAARNDMTQQVEEMFGQAASQRKELWIYEGSSVQGTYILEGADGPDMQSRLLDFIARMIKG